MKKENEKLEARVEALENRVRTLEAMFKSLSAYAPPCAHNSSPETQRTLPLKQGEYPKGEGVDYPTRGVDNTRQVVHANGLNEKAWELMEKARKGGLLDEEYMPTGSRTEAALLAGAIAYDSHLEKKWTPFEKLWKIKHLRNYLDKATFLKSYPSYIARINHTLSLTATDNATAMQPHTLVQKQ